MLKRLSIIALVSVAMAGAKTYNFMVSDRTQVCHAQLKPGEYSLKVDGSQIILKDDAGNQIDVFATVQDGNQKFDRTAVFISKADGGNRVLAVQLGGSRMTVVFQSGEADRTQ